MAKITRGNIKISAFGEDAQNRERTTFNTTDQSNGLTANMNASFIRGWGVIDNDAVVVDLEDMNAAQYTISLVNKMLAQQGILEWASEQDFFTGSISKDQSGNLFVSLIGNDTTPNVGRVLTDTNAWKPVSDGLPLPPLNNAHYVLRFNNGDLTWVNSDDRYAALLGNRANQFNVADATNPSNAVNRRQLDTKQDGLTAGANITIANDVISSDAPARVSVIAYGSSAVGANLRRSTLRNGIYTAPTSANRTHRGEAIINHGTPVPTNPTAYRWEERPGKIRIRLDSLRSPARSGNINLTQGITNFDKIQVVCSGRLGATAILNADVDFTSKTFSVVTPEDANNTELASFIAFTISRSNVRITAQGSSNHQGQIDQVWGIR